MKEKGSFAAFFFSHQQRSDRVFQLNYHWIGLKLVLSVLDILVVYSNGEDQIRMSARSCFRSQIEAGLG